MSGHYREKSSFRTGIIGTVVLLLLTVVVLNVNSLPLVKSPVAYHALFSDCAGLAIGDSVRVAGVRVGKVSNISISGTAVDVSFTLDDTVKLGIESTVSIVTASALGTKEIRLEPAGEKELRRGATIDINHTNSPYDLTDALADLTNAESAIDVDQLAHSLKVTSSVLQKTPEDFKAAVDGVEKLSTAISSRDDSLGNLLSSAEKVTSVLAQRSEQVNTLILDANVVLAELMNRREVIGKLAENISNLAKQLSLLVHNNQDELEPALTHLNSVLQVLDENRNSIGLAIERLGPYVTELGEAVSSGPFFSSYIQNLIPGQIIDPFVRAALGEGAP
ncbi:MAG: MCE family protein [Mycobacteriaceae bacterium]